MKYKGIIFDLDGVIVASDELHFRAWQEIAGRLGIPFNREINSRLKGLGRMESLDVLLASAGKECTDSEKQQLAAQKNAVYRNLIAKLTPTDLPFSVIDTLSTLRTLGLRIAVGSSSKNTKYLLELIGLNGFFDAVSDGTNISFCKPNPEVFIKAADMLLLLPGNCLVVDDSLAGIDAALNGGFDAVGIGDASRYERATYQIKDICEVIDIVKTDIGKN